MNKFSKDLPIFNLQAKRRRKRIELMLRYKIRRKMFFNKCTVRNKIFLQELKKLIKQ